jgi:hypothetical protein
MPPRPKNRSRQDKKYDVFLNFSFKDKAACDRVCEELELRGWSVWCCTKEMSEGDFQEKIGKVIEKCRVFVALLSASSQAPECNAVKEIKFAINRRSATLKAQGPGQEVDVQPIIFFHLDSAELCKALEIQVVDFHRINTGTTNWKARLPELLDAVEREVGVSAAQPSWLNRAWRRLVHTSLDTTATARSWAVKTVGEGFRIIFTLIAISVMLVCAFGIWGERVLNRQFVERDKDANKDKEKKNGTETGENTVPPGPASNDPIFGLLEIDSSGMSAFATTFKINFSNKRATEVAAEKRIKRIDWSALEFDAGTQTFRTSLVVAQAKRVMDSTQKEANQPIEWFVVINSSVRRMSKLTWAVDDLKYHLNKELACEVATTTLDEECEALVDGIIPPPSRDSSVLVHVGLRSVKACYYSPPVGADKGARYRPCYCEIPDASGLFLKRDALPNKHDRELHAARVRKEADINILEPLDIVAERYPAFVNKRNVYMVGDSVLALCRSIRSDVAIDLEDVEFGKFADDVKDFHKFIVVHGDDLPKRMPTSPLKKIQRAAFEADRSNLFKQMTDSQMITSAEVLDALIRGLNLDPTMRSGNITVVFRQKAFLDWPAEILRRRIDSKNKVAAIPGALRSLCYLDLVEVESVFARHHMFCRRITRQWMEAA